MLAGLSSLESKDCAAKYYCATGSKSPQQAPCEVGYHCPPGSGAPVR